MFQQDCMNIKAEMVQTSVGHHVVKVTNVWCEIWDILTHFHCMGLWIRAYGVQINSYCLQRLVNSVSCSFCE